MSIFNQFPWTNFREYNLDWVIKTVKSSLEDVSDAVSTYFAEHIDNTLSVSGDAADAAVTGTRIASNASNISNLQGRMTTVEGYGSDITTLQSDVAALQGVQNSIFKFVYVVNTNSSWINNYVEIESGSLADPLAKLDAAAPIVVYAHENTWTAWELAYGLKVIERQPTDPETNFYYTFIIDGRRNGRKKCFLYGSSNTTRGTIVPLDFYVYSNDGGTTYSLGAGNNLTLEYIAGTTPDPDFKLSNIKIVVDGKSYPADSLIKGGDGYWHIKYNGTHEFYLVSGNNSIQPVS